MKSENLIELHEFFIAQVFRKIIQKACNNDILVWTLSDLAIL